MRWRLWEVAAFAAAAAVFIAHAWYLAVAVEDSFITFRFARHLVAGEGLVWNLGEAPVEGYTNFLWVLIAGAVIAAGLDPVLPAQVLGVASGLATLALAVRIGARHLPGGRLTGWLAVVFLVVSGPMAAWSSSALATVFFTFWVTAVCAAALQWLESGTRSSLYVAFVMCLGATLTRPEGGLVAAWLLMLVLVTPLPGGRWRDDVVLPALTFLVPATIYLMARVAYFDAWLPMTFHAKTHAGVAQVLRGALYLAYFALHFLLPFVPLIALWLCAARRLRREASIGSERGRREQLRTPRGAVVSLAVLSCLYLGYVVMVGGDYMAMYRFCVPVLPIIYLLLASAAAWLWGPAAPRARRALVAAVLVAISMTALQSSPLEARIFRRPGLMHGTWRGVQTERWHVRRLALLARFFIARRSSPEESLGVRALGVIPWLWEGPAFSFFGLVDPVIALAPPERAPGAAVPGMGFPGHDREDPLRVMTRRPTFVMFSRDLTPEPSAGPEWSQAAMAIVDAEYRLESVWLEDPANDDGGFFSYLRRVEAAGREPMAGEKSR